MKLTEKETLLLYQVLRAANAAITNHKLDVIRQFLANGETNREELDATFDFHDNLTALLRRVANEVESPRKKPTKKKRKGRKSEPGT
jgi:hypothetical protein